MHWLFGTVRGLVVCVVLGLAGWAVAYATILQHERSEPAIALDASGRMPTEGRSLEPVVLTSSPDADPLLARPATDRELARSYGASANPVVACQGYVLLLADQAAMDRFDRSATRFTGDGLTFPACPARQTRALPKIVVAR